MNQTELFICKKVFKANLTTNPLQIKNPQYLIKAILLPHVITQML